ncbi:MAG: tetratricopeptide repeat protein, partial [Acidimicrobiia bacterium]
LLTDLSGRTALLVVDNCEHLVGAAAGLIDQVLGTSASLAVVATSRELLGIAGEVAFGLRSLRLPLVGDTPSPAELVEYDGIQLFVERATAAKPDFRIDDDNAESVLEICRRLDGMPLALELAASRVRSFSVAKIAELLDQRFRLLTGGSRTALPRQQTLAATIEWSYRLLDDSEQVLLRRLSAFQGGFTYESVAEVAIGDPIDEFDLMELLPSLVDKSLVVADEVDGQVRYRLLETIRQFARDLFEDTDETDDVRLRHAEHFTTLAEEAGRHIRGPDEGIWWARIDQELDNLRLAATWAVEHDRATLALRLVSGFWRYWWFKARWIEGATWIEGVLDAAADEADDLLLAQGLLAHGSLVEGTNPETRARLGLRRDPEASLERSVELYAALHAAGTDAALLRQGYCAALVNLGVLAEIQGDVDRTQDLMREALRVARELDDVPGITVALGNLAEGAVEAGDFDEARRLHDEAIAVADQLGSNARLADTWSQRSQIELEAGDVEAAGAALRTARRHAAAADLPHLMAFLDACLALNAAFAGSGDAQQVRASLAAVGEYEAVVRNPRFAVDLAVCLLVAEALDGEDEGAAVAFGILRVLPTEARYLEYHLAPIVADVRDRLGDAAFEAAVARGAALDPDEVVSLLVG